MKTKHASRNRRIIKTKTKVKRKTKTKRENKKIMQMRGGNAEQYLNIFSHYMRGYGDEITEDNIRKAIQFVKDCDIGDLTETETHDGTPMGLYIVRNILENYDPDMEDNRNIDQLFVDYASEIIKRIVDEGYSYLLTEVDDSSSTTILMTACKNLLFLNIALQLVKTHQFNLTRENESGKSCLRNLVSLLNKYHNDTGILLENSGLFSELIKYCLAHDANNDAFKSLVEIICNDRVAYTFYSHLIPDCRVVPVEEGGVEISGYTPQSSANIMEPGEEHSLPMTSEEPRMVLSTEQVEGTPIEGDVDSRASDPHEPGILLPKRRFPEGTGGQRRKNKRKTKKDK
jgi:hypothetical protein